MKSTMRIFLALLAGLLLVFAGTGCTAKAKKAYHLSRANHYYDAGQFGDAEIEYLNVWRLDPANPQVNARLGLLYYDEGRLQRAVFFLTKAGRSDPENLEVRVKLGFIYSAVGEFSNALAQAAYVLQKNPQDDQAPLLLAEATVYPKDAAGARQLLQNMARKGDRASIEVALGNLALRDHDVTNAMVAYKRGQALDAKSAAVNAGLAMAAWAQNDLKQADAFFKQAADASPIRSPRRVQYVRFKVQTGDLAGARALLGDILKAAPDYIPASRALAEIAAAEKKYDECAALLDNVLRLDPDNFDALLFEGQLDLAQNKPEQAVAHMERMARLYSQIPGVHYQLARAYLAADNPVKATASLNRALEISPNFPEATMLLAEIQIKSGNPNDAIIGLERLRQKQPNLAPAQLLLALAYRAGNRPGDALAIYQALETAYPTNADVSRLRGETLLQTRDTAGAHKAFERALEVSPGNLAAIEQLVKLDDAEKQFDAATQFINGEIQKAPKQPALRILAASIQADQGKWDQAEAILLQALDIDPANLGASILLAEVYINAGQNDKAQAKLDAILAKNPENTGAYLLQAKLYSTTKDNRKAADVYEKILKIDPRNSLALNNLAYLYSEPLHNLDRAYELGQRARQLAPSDPSTADTLGWICFQRGSYETALDLEKESAAKLAEPEVQFHLGMAGYMTADETTARTALQRAWQSGVDFTGRAGCGLCLSILAVNPDTADATARAMLEKRVADKPDDPIALARLARIYQHEGNTGKAIAAYEAMLQVPNKKLDAMVALSQLYAATDAKKAYDMAKAANQLAPSNPQVSRTLGRLAFLSGDYSLAASALQQAMQSLPDDASLLFDYAQAAYSIGRVSDAQTALQSALGSNLSAGQAGQARQMLDMIILAAAPAQAAAADARINDILKSDPDNVPALMARAAASASSGDVATAGQACEKALVHYPDFIPAQTQLARLYATDPAKLDRAYALAAKAHAALPDDAGIAKILGIILIQRADYNHAITLLKQSAIKLNADPEVYYYLGAAQFQLKNKTEARTSLQQALTLNLPAQLASSAQQMLRALK